MQAASPSSQNPAGAGGLLLAVLVAGIGVGVLVGWLAGSPGVGALIGRTLTPDDARVPGGQPVVILSNAFWRRRFGSDPGVVGKTIRLDGHPMTVVGITPAGFQGIEAAHS